MAVLCVCVRADSASLTQAIALSLPSYPQLNMNPITLLICEWKNVRAWEEIVIFLSWKEINMKQFSTKASC